MAVQGNDWERNAAGRAVWAMEIASILLSKYVDDDFWVLSSICEDLLVLATEPSGFHWTSRMPLVEEARGVANVISGKEPSPQGKIVVRTPQLLDPLVGPAHSIPEWAGEVDDATFLNPWFRPVISLGRLAR